MWALHRGYRTVEAVSVDKETPQMVFYYDRARDGITKAYKTSFYSWRGDEATARKLEREINRAQMIRADGINEVETDFRNAIEGIFDDV